MSQGESLGNSLRSKAGSIPEKLVLMALCRRLLLHANGQVGLTPLAVEHKFHLQNNPAVLKILHRRHSKTLPLVKLCPVSTIPG